MIYFILWYLAISIAGLIGLPWAAHSFRRLPDHGYAFTKTLGFLLISFFVWLLGSLGLLNNDPTAIIAVVAILIAAGAVFQIKRGWVDIKGWFSQQFGWVLAVEGFFLLVFAGWAIIRAYNPDILGTEKPMEFMFLNAILRSPTLPPQDAWLSGYAISYYYFGYLQISLLARITGTPPQIAYNLAQALIFSLTATGALGTIANLVSLAKKNINRPSERMLNSFLPALLGPLLVLLVGNFYAPLEIIHDNGLLAQSAIAAIWYDYGTANNPNAITQLSDFQQPPGIKIGSIDLWKWLDLKGLENTVTIKPASFQWTVPEWFFASRVLHDRGLSGAETEVIDEMPAFSFLLGDLHPHVLALPFIFLAMILSLDWFLVAQEHARKAINNATGLQFPGWGRIVLSGIILGSLIFLNTWDFPIYAFITAMAILAGAASVLGKPLLPHAWRLTGWIFSILGLSLVAYIPFFITFQSQAGGLMANLIYPTRFQQVVVMFGPLLVVITFFVAWLVIHYRRLIHWKIVWLVGGGLLLGLALISAGFLLLSAFKPGLPQGYDLSVYALPAGQTLQLLLQRRLVDSLTALFAVTIVGLLAGLAAGLLNKPGEPQPEAESTGAPTPDHVAIQPTAISPAVWMAGILILTGALLLAGPEFVYLRDNFGTRMNTVFKFYFQIWVLWGTASAFGLWYLMQAARPALRAVAGVCCGAAILAGLLYLPSGLVTKTASFTAQPTLDGMAYFAKDDADNWAAIQWLQKNVPGNPVILEGTRGAYWIEGRSSRISMATGLPTLMGWMNHEGQWRGSDYGKVAQREGDIQTIYQSRDWVKTDALLSSYNVSYIILSPLEKNWYRPVYGQKFDDHLKRVFQSGDLVIYQR